jgi:glycosyltransferase involved in cell wall biosynthesis
LTSAKQLSICHFDAERKFSGGELQVFLLMRGLRARGHRCILVAPADSIALQRARSEGFEVRACALRSGFDLFSVAGASRLLRELRPDVVHLHTSRAAWLGGMAARRGGIPAIFTRRMDPRIRPGWRTRCVYERRTLKVAAISGSVAEALSAGGVPSERIVLIRSSIDPASCTARRSREAVRAELGVEPGETLVLTLGALVPRKGLDVLLAALAQLARRGLSPRVCIAGEGEQRAELERLAGTLGLERVMFLGQRSDSADLLAAADLFAMPSRREGLGVAALEALAAACPLVASRVGGLAEVVEHEVSGLLVAPEDPTALALALERLVREPALRERLATAGRARLDALYHAEHMVAAYEALYRSVLAQAAATASAR